VTFYSVFTNQRGCINFTNYTTAKV